MSHRCRRNHSCQLDRRLPYFLLAGIGFGRERHFGFVRHIVHIPPKTVRILADEDNRYPSPQHRNEQMTFRVVVRTNE